MADELIDFLRARLNEDEALALQASSGPWADQTGQISGGSDGRVLVAQQVQAWNAAHIASHDPARVLREIDGKRRLITMGLSRASEVDHELGCGHEADEIEAGLCPAGTGDIGELRLLAVSYVTHPDYREEWRP